MSGKDLRKRKVAEKGKAKEKDNSVEEEELVEEEGPVKKSRVQDGQEKEGGITPTFTSTVAVKGEKVYVTHTTWTLHPSDVGKTGIIYVPPKGSPKHQTVSFYRLYKAQGVGKQAVFTPLRLRYPEKEGTTARISFPPMRFEEPNPHHQRRKENNWTISIPLTCETQLSQLIQGLANTHCEMLAGSNAVQLWESVGVEQPTLQDLKIYFRTGVKSWHPKDKPEATNIDLRLTFKTNRASKPLYHLNIARQIGNVFNMVPTFPENIEGGSTLSCIIEATDLYLRPSSKQPGYECGQSLTVHEMTVWPSEEDPIICVD